MYAAYRLSDDSSANAFTPYHSEIIDGDTCLLLYKKVYTNEKSINSNHENEMLGIYLNQLVQVNEGFQKHN